MYLASPPYYIRDLITLCVLILTTTTTTTTTTTHTHTHTHTHAHTHTHNTSTIYPAVPAAAAVYADDDATGKNKNLLPV